MKNINFLIICISIWMKFIVVGMVVSLPGCSESDDSVSILNCEGGALFDYGIETAMFYEKGKYDDIVPSLKVLYEYDETGRLKRYLNAYWTGIEFTSYDSRDLFYNDAGQIERVEWLSAFGEARWIFKYDNRGLPASQTIIFNIEAKESSTVYVYEYGPDDRLKRRLEGWGEDAFEQLSGTEYHYDDHGRLQKTVEVQIDSVGNWIESGDDTVYEYDTRDRVISMSRRIVVNEKQSESVIDERIIEYDDHTGHVTNIITLYNGKLDCTEEYIYEDNKLTIERTSEYSGKINQKKEFTYTENGNSAFKEAIYPGPFLNMLTFYGYGNINGCLN